ncbi:hypothetical protein FN846DRAFT_956238 [Sphaerosporella brunnea]|uniref:NIF system FeS cluster assembly NifU N-terminal domain-containing protein n=1 Tax=Sphaerosporella brunnea TaxID=1250544 RepID=A0A5J5ESW0_9PEZI|nr:hypothetical protein FN846DRAFT_956238 [Sphaerosporella brunnea]
MWERWPDSPASRTPISQRSCVSPVKLHCPMLAEDAIKSAIRDYQNKSKRAKQTMGDAL